MAHRAFGMRTLSSPPLLALSLDYGNKRIAFFATDTFLRMNGHFIKCDNDEAYAFFMRRFETRSFRFSELSSWLEQKVEPLPGS